MKNTNHNLNLLFCLKIKFIADKIELKMREASERFTLENSRGLVGEWAAMSVMMGLGF